MPYTRIVPLGGLGEVGMNCLALESRDGILVIDCGVTFPHAEPGVDVIHPDFSYLWDRRESVLGVVVTHGHEDHIGALPYLLRRIPVPVWAPPYALTLIRHRLAEHADVPAVDLRPTAPRVRFEIGPFDIEPLRVTHSIPDATALAIEAPGARIFHTGDFKLDHDPPDGQPSDHDRFRELGDAGVDVMLSDSTNVDVPGRAAREREVARVLGDVVERERGRVVVGLFASNVLRMQAVFDAAVRTGRRVVLLGRSVINHVRAAQDLGWLKFPSDRLVPPEVAMALPRGEVIAVATGTQAEPRTALARLAWGDHPKFVVERGDAVIFSSRAIPGNERALSELVCDFERRGVVVHVAWQEGGLHASGHAARGEQAEMLQWLRPRGFVPIHGTFHHLRRHAELARSLGVEQIEVIENGATVAFRDGVLTRGDEVPHGRVYVDEGEELSEALRNERVALASHGAVFATVELDARGALLGAPRVSTKGVVLDNPPDVVDAAAAVAVEEALRLARGARDVLPEAEAQEAMRMALRRIYRVGSKRPVVVVHVKRR